MGLVIDLDFIYTYACIRADDRTTRAANACVWLRVDAEVIAAMIYLLAKAQTLSRACHYAEIATFATVLINYYGSFNFCHYI